VVYDGDDRLELLSVLAHETSHVVMGAYFAKGKTPIPDWLDEGLAVTAENAASGVTPGPWEQALLNLDGDSVDLSKVFAQGPDPKSSSDEAAQWYLQAYAAVGFLFQPSKKIQFGRLCQLLRDGVAAQPALWQSYRFQDVQKFQAALLQWLEAQKRQSVKSVKQYNFIPPVFRHQ
jgi:hypothetical protein